MKRGFSLIELIVVLGILSLLMGASAVLLRGETREAHVKAAAEELAAVLRDTRKRAMHDKAAYAVVFNIQNQPGTSGRVLNNGSGGHWYRVVGPSTYGSHESLFGSGASGRSIPLPGAFRTMGGWANSNFPDFVERLRASWVGEPHVLPPGRVRFLALSDTDEGPRNNRSSAWRSRVGDQTYYGVSGETTYPRPWFGYYDAAAGRLYPWGGYDPAKSHDGRNYSGFYYEGGDGDVVGSRHPTDRTYNNDFDGSGDYANIDINGDGDVDDPFEREVGYPVWKEGEPRPLVNADWMDAAIMFVPTGEAFFLEWARGRWVYSAVQRDLSDAKGNGVRDMSKFYKTNTQYGGSFRHENNVSTEVAHFDRHTGGWHITLGPDAIVDDDRFPDAQSALASVLPAYRVYVGRSGVVRTFRVQRRSDTYLDDQNVWPSTPSTWIDTSSGRGNPIWRRCRLGSLHADHGSDNYRLEPVGRPITGVVTERMLTDRIWWIDE